MVSRSEEYSYKCSECNNPVNEDDKYCQNCGADLRDTIYEDENKQNSIINTASYVSLNSKTTWLIALLSFTILVGLIAIFADMSQVNLIQKVIDGYSISEVDVTENDSRVQTIGIFQIFVFITTAIFFLFWKNQAYKNLEPLNTNGRESK